MKTSLLSKLKAGFFAFGIFLVTVVVNAQQTELLNHAWSENCANPEATVVRFLSRDGNTLTEKIYFQGGVKAKGAINIINKVEELGQGRIAMTQEASGTTETIRETIELNSAGYRVLSRRVGLPYPIAGGQFLSSNKPTPVIARCSSHSSVLAANPGIQRVGVNTSVQVSQATSQFNPSTSSGTPIANPISADTPRGFTTLPNRVDGWGGVECDPAVDPDQWHLCNVMPLVDRMSLYEKNPKTKERIARSMEIAQISGSRLFFKNGVVVMEYNNHIENKRYNDIERKRLAGDFAGALALEAQIKNAADAESARAQSAFQRRVQAEAAVMRRQCVGKPALSTDLLENLSRWVRANPSQIEMNRLEILDYTCTAVFRHPNGTSRCSIEFDDRGRIVNLRSCS